MMWPESSEQAQPLRTGFTTGTCATACSVACVSSLFTQQLPAQVSVTLPKGKTVELTVNAEIISTQSARASTIKDAGDDPDITHGAKIWVELTLTTNPGVYFIAGEGVGSVTKAGLLLDVGEPAINPVPRKMISENLQKVAQNYRYGGGFQVTIGVENGAALALKTMNPRLGIIGGLSILGTSGIVRPYSCAAWIASIYQAIDVAHANAVKHLAATTGSTSEKTVKNHYAMPDSSLIEMGDFVGALLKHLKKVAVPALTICGGFGKITKLANNAMDLHSRVSQIDFQHLSDIAASIGASRELQQQIQQANTSIEALSLCQAQHIPLGDAICQSALMVCLSRLENTELEIIAVDRRGNRVGRAASQGFEEVL
jgi:cobalt-precorrin-5B (C1)-methyltransferase